MITRIVKAFLCRFFTVLTSLLFDQERSLTTILYLMSLTEEARAPFSLVDEINQVRCHDLRPSCVTDVTIEHVDFMNSSIQM
jgi:hypothetical protein